nr:hypothetical protein [candidate division Zixibacteria bacterium]
MKTRYIISLIILLAVLAAWFFFLVSPEIKKQKELKASLASSELILNDYRNIMDRFPQYFKAQQTLSERRKNLLSKLYTREDLLKLFDRITRESERHNLNLVEISPSVEELLELNRTMPTNDQPHLLNIIIRQRGKFKDIGQYIKFIEAQDFYRGTNHCRVSNPTDGRSFADVTYGFKAILGTIKDN